MFDLTSYLYALLAMFMLATFAWSISVAKGDTGIVDSFWSLFFMLAMWIFFTMNSDLDNIRSVIVLVLVNLLHDHGYAM